MWIARVELRTGTKNQKIWQKRGIKWMQASDEKGRNWEGECEVGKKKKSYEGERGRRSTSMATRMKKKAMDGHKNEKKRSTREDGWHMDAWLQSARPFIFYTYTYGYRHGYRHNGHSAIYIHPHTTQHATYPPCLKEEAAIGGDTGNKGVRSQTKLQREKEERGVKGVGRRGWGKEWEQRRGQRRQGRRRRRRGCGRGEGVGERQKKKERKIGWIWKNSKNEQSDEINTR